MSARRKALWAGRVAYHYTMLRNHPRVVSNSVHKAGTHLLRGALRAIPGLHDYGRSSYWHYLFRTRNGQVTDTSSARAARKLKSALPGEIIRGHIGADNPEIKEILDSSNFKHVLIYRDPRDIVVSQFFWWTTRQRAAYWPYRHFASLDTDAEKIAFLIAGCNGTSDAADSRLEYPDIGARLREFSGWLDDDSCLSVRFEDLVDPTRRATVCEGILGHIFPEARKEELGETVQRMIEGMDPSRSKTFRKGRTGGWRELFTPEHAELFKHHAGDLLVALGYEVDR